MIDFLRSQDELLSAITGILAIYVAVRSLPPVSRFLGRLRVAQLRWWLTRHRLRGLAPKLPHPAPSWRKQWERAGRRFDGFEETAASEIDWVSKAMGLDHAVTFAVDKDGHRLLDTIAGVYRSLAARLRTRSLLGASQAFLEAEADLASAVHERCLAHLSLLLPEETEDSSFDPHLRRRSSKARIMISTTAWPASAQADLAVSWIRTDPPLRDLEATDVALTSARHVYDGVLPRLLGWRLQKDQDTGAPVLHLSIGETTYFTHLVVSNPSNKDHNKDDQNVLTLSLLAITRDDCLVLTKRSSRETDIYRHEWAPTVNGNLDIGLSARKPGDRDSHGFLDFRKALCREALEEIGVDLRPEAVVFDGLAQIRSQVEWGSYVLCASAFVDVTAEELCHGGRYADRIHGRWELGGAARVIRRPTTEAAAQELLRWLWGEPDVMPHTFASIQLFLQNEGLVKADWYRKVPQMRQRRPDAVRDALFGVSPVAWRGGQGGWRARLRRSMGHRG